MTAIDLAAPMLRYGHARAAGMGVHNIRFVQGNVETLAFPDGHFDFVYSTMFFHETSHGALRRILRETDRVLAPAGCTSTSSSRRIAAWTSSRSSCATGTATTTTSRSGRHCTTPTCRPCSGSSGFRGDRLFETQIHAIVEDEMPKVAGEVEDFGRGGMWYAFGSERVPSTPGNARASQAGDMKPEDVLRLANAAPSGKRPHFFADADIDRLLAIVWAMAGELAVTRERLDTVERLLAARDTLARADIEAYRPDPEAARERGQWQLEYIGRLLRVLQQEVEAMQRGAGRASPPPKTSSRELASR